MMKNHESQPTRTTPFLKASFVNFNRGQDHGHGRGRDRGRGRNNYHFRGGPSYNPNFKRTTRTNDHKGKAPQKSKSDEEICYRYEMTRH